MNKYYTYEWKQKRPTIRVMSRFSTRVPLKLIGISLLVYAQCLLSGCMQENGSEFIRPLFSVLLFLPVLLFRAARNGVNGQVANTE